MHPHQTVRFLALLASAAALSHVEQGELAFLANLSRAHGQYDAAIAAANTQNPGGIGLAILNGTAPAAGIVFTPTPAVPAAHIVSTPAPLPAPAPQVVAPVAGTVPSTPPAAAGTVTAPTAPASGAAQPAPDAPQAGLMDNLTGMLSSRGQIVASNRQLTGENGNLRAQIAAMTGEVSELRAGIARFQAERAQLQSLVDQAGGQITTLSQAVTTELAGMGVPQAALPTANIVPFHTPLGQVPGTMAGTAIPVPRTDAELEAAIATPGLDQQAKFAILAAYEARPSAMPATPAPSAHVPDFASGVGSLN